MKKTAFYSTIAASAVLAILKITGVIAWSWWWITAPIWIPFLIAVIVVVWFYRMLEDYTKGGL